MKEIVYVYENKNLKQLCQTFTDQTLEKRPCR